MTATAAAPVVDEAYQSVAQAFYSVLERTGGGGALAVYRHGRRIVSAWGGLTRNGDPWSGETVAAGWSTSKGITALILQVLVEDGELELDRPVADYWEAFAAEGKATVTTRHLLTHTAGLPFWPGYAEIVSMGSTEGWDRQTDIADALAASPLQWPAGAAAGYHALTYGWLVDETVRRATGRHLGDHLADRIAGPLAARASFGLPEGTAWAPLRTPVMGAGEALANVRRAADPGILSGQSMLSTSRDAHLAASDSANSESFRRGRVPGANAFVSADGLARIYAPLASDGELDGVRLVSPSSIARHSAVEVDSTDLVLCIRLRRALGYVRASPGEAYALRDAAFGHAGFGGQLGFADPSSGIAFGFVTDTPLCTGEPDWRTEWLVAALYVAAFRADHSTAGGTRGD
jgi:CubicO group peptidase (beta-lactamase class C family)